MAVARPHLGGGHPPGADHGSHGGDLGVIAAAAGHPGPPLSLGG